MENTLQQSPSDAAASSIQTVHPRFNLELRESDMIYEHLQPAEGTSGRLTMYKKSISSLPLPPALWDAFQRACSKDASSQQLGEIIKDDPVLSASILRFANAAGIVHTPINDIGRAISRLGNSMVRSLVAKHSFTSTSATGKVYDIPMLWKHGMAVSALAEIVADHIPGCNRDVAGTIGLFHDVGRMGFNLINEFIQPAELNPAKGHLVYENERFGCTHIDMGLLLADHWQLPETIRQGISYHHHPAYAEADAIPAEIRAEVLAVYLADLLAIRLDCAGGNPGIILPHASFADMLSQTTLAAIANDKKVSSELALVQSMEF